MSQDGPKAPPSLPVADPTVVRAPFFTFLRRDTVVTTEILLANACAHVLALAFPLAILIVIDKVIVHKGIETLDVLIIALVAVALFDMLLNIASSLMRGRQELVAEHEISASVVANALESNLAHLQRTGLPELVGLLADAKQMAGAHLKFLFIPLLDIGFAILIILALFVINPNLAKIALVALPLQISVMVLGSLRQRKLATAARQLEIAEHSVLNSALSGIEAVKATATEGVFYRIWNTSSLNGKTAGASSLKVTTLSSSLSQFIQKLVAAAVLWFGAQMVIANELTLGQLIAFNLLSMRLQVPINSTQRAVLAFTRAQESRARLKESPSLAAPAFAGSLSAAPVLDGTVASENLSFSFDGATPILDGVSFNVEAGTSLALVGASGGGKSTLIRMLMGFHQPSSGQVRLSGKNLATLIPSSYRSQIGYVPQAYHIFGGTVAGNVAMGDNEIDLKEVERACQLADAADFVSDLKDGFQTMLNDGGVQLSGGQRQRLAIARALYGTPKLILLDEMSSGLDDQSELAIRKSLRSLAGECTVIVATHRTGILEDVDHILRFENGRISEQDPANKAASS